MYSTLSSVLIVITYITLCWACLGLFLKSLDAWLLRRKLNAIVDSYAKLLGSTFEEAQERLNEQYEHTIERSVSAPHDDYRRN